MLSQESFEHPEITLGASLDQFLVIVIVVVIVTCHYVICTTYAI